jgi:hypothetical protein
MPLHYKLQLMQRLQQACAVFLGENVANRQRPAPRSIVPPFAPPSNISYHLSQKNENG